MALEAQRVLVQGQGCHLLSPAPPPLLVDMVGWESDGPDLQLEGRGDVEKATDGWLEGQEPGWVWALQEEGLQDGGDQEEEFCSSQALPEADTLTWRGQGDGAGPALLTPRPQGEG